VCWIQHYVIKFVSDLWQVGGFLRLLRFPPPIKLTAMIRYGVFWLDSYMMVRPLILWVSDKNPVFQFLFSLTLWHKFIPPLNLTFLVFRCIPTEVSINEKALIRDVRCGVDGTMFITDVGSVYACAPYRHNSKLIFRYSFVLIYQLHVELFSNHQITMFACKFHIWN
jgi:hypothetical protein